MLHSGCPLLCYSTLLSGCLSFFQPHLSYSNTALVRASQCMLLHALSSRTHVRTHTRTDQEMEVEVEVEVKVALFKP